MPISSFMGLETSLRGLLAQQRALDVTTHNITNADRAGYTRQEAVMAAASALEIPSSALDGRLQAIGANAATEYADITGPNGPVMNAATELQQLNVAIRDAVRGGGSPNDLLDRRDEILDGLSLLGQVSVT